MAAVVSTVITPLSARMYRIASRRFESRSWLVLCRGLHDVPRVDPQRHADHQQRQPVDDGLPRHLAQHAARHKEDVTQDLLRTEDRHQQAVDHPQVSIQAAHIREVLLVGQRAPLGLQHPPEVERHHSVDDNGDQVVGDCAASAQQGPAHLKTGGAQQQPVDQRQQVLDERDERGQQDAVEEDRRAGWPCVLRCQRPPGAGPTASGTGRWAGPPRSGPGPGPAPRPCLPRSGSRMERSRLISPHNTTSMLISATA